jgi:hypothetical protein
MINKLVIKKKHFNLYVDKNNSVYDIKDLNVKSWKQESKKRVPEEIEEVRNEYFFNKYKGNPLQSVINKIKTELYLENV